MVLSWNEIKERAVAFVREWQSASQEEADAKSFLDAFFHIFGISRRKVATFEYKVKKLNNNEGYIDLLWKGTLLVEMKSRGKNLERALIQAKEYLVGLKDYELPRYILVCDFANFHLHDLENDSCHRFALNELLQNIELFGFIAGYQKRTYREQDPVNVQAAEIMAQLHDKLKEAGYEGHPLEVYLVRLLFCLFADDTTIFEKDLFTEFIELRTAPDGSDLGARLSELFYILNTPEEKRLKNLDEHLARFPYINGKLFEEYLPPAAFDTSMRNLLLQACYLDWGNISPAIFGAMFQCVMDPVSRRNLGAHYTSEINILKLIKPLFLDTLYQELESIKNNRLRLIDFHQKLSRLTFLDPACGCGNFLVVTYRELRLLELQVLRLLYGTGQGVLDIRDLVKVQITQMYGIEYEEFPARIAEVAMWLIDHQMNMRISFEFGQYFVRLPLTQSANICHANALEISWENIITPSKLSYILGNPPFVGSKLMKPQQRQELLNVMHDVENAGVLDYVTAWYIKAARYIQGTSIKVAFVSTNSIVQGEQVAFLWQPLMQKYNIKIHFAHRTFKWSNEARDVAAVYCVIIGFAAFDTPDKVIFDYQDIKGEPFAIKAKNINPYLIDARDIFIIRRSKPICNVPPMSFGNMPLDGGNLLFSDEEKEEFLCQEPGAAPYILPFISAHEFLNGKKRWCLWLVDAEPHVLKKMPKVLEKIEAVRKFRLASKRKQTIEKATTPALFGEIRNFGKSYIVVPRVSSENREYIPMGFFDKNSIVGDTCMTVPNGTLYHFGIMSSRMHMCWTLYVCGRLENRYRYSKDIVYNNFPWPQNLTERQVLAIEKAAEGVLLARKQFPESSLAVLYDPLSMPPILLKAHRSLDKAVDQAYHSTSFTSDTQRIQFLFDLYEKYTLGLFSEQQAKKRSRKSNKK
ncbi:MAG: class I SAM-dependent DNA methyltransferase [Bacteroidia bacterium]|nr:class I SAM-dependent DNA methyltransferase [Bacteroidia bacterium]MDW8158225.1 class I SAM-dependent DNA methyltransferase [Bacteroidia bacterium]